MVLSGIVVDTTLGIWVGIVDLTRVYLARPNKTRWTDIHV
jgi:hypothetical protein